jgi:hypothetical protein
MVTKSSVLSFAVILVGVALCLPELIAKGEASAAAEDGDAASAPQLGFAFAGTNTAWAGNVYWFHPSLMLLLSLATLWVTHKKSWPVVLGATTCLAACAGVILSALQLSLASLPAVVSSCCCFPNQCFFSQLADVHSAAPVVALNHTACSQLRSTACGTYDPRASVSRGAPFRCASCGGLSGLARFVAHLRSEPLLEAVGLLGRHGLADYRCRHHRRGAGVPAIGPYVEVGCHHQASATIKHNAAVLVLRAARGAAARLC